MVTFTYPKPFILTIWSYALTIALTPLISITVVIIAQRFRGEFGLFYESIRQLTWIERLEVTFHPSPIGTYQSWAYFLAYVAWCVIFSHFCSGGDEPGPASPMNHRPMYKSGGLKFFIFTLQAYLFLGGYLELISLSYLHDDLLNLIKTANAFALLFCAFLYVKGLYFPSSKDNSTSQSFLYDYYSGTELHPVIFGIPVKQLFINRYSMTLWALITLSCVFKNFETSQFPSDGILVSAGLQILYLTKFFVWESGYNATYDVIKENTGFYLIWGVLVFVPSVYVMPSLYLVHHPQNPSRVVSAIQLILGVSMIYLTYAVDKQKQLVRETDGKCKIWGKEAEVIRAEWTDADGNKRVSLLLYSGYWGLSRHFHYLPEALATLCWTLPAGFGSIYPYVYVIFLTLMLYSRVSRLEEESQARYRKFWEIYKRKVPYALIPSWY